MGGVLHDAVGFAGASCEENVQDGWERGTDDLCIYLFFSILLITVVRTLSFLLQLHIIKKKKKLTHCCC